MRVLVVEDEPILADAIAEWLRREAFAVDVVHRGDEAQERLVANNYDVLVLDRDIPVVHGDEVCRSVAGGATRILMLTAASAVRDRVAGLALGADDYLPKPFAFVELSARVHALLTTLSPPPDPRTAPPVGSLTRTGVIHTFVVTLYE